MRSAVVVGLVGTALAAALSACAAPQHLFDDDSGTPEAGPKADSGLDAGGGDGAADSGPDGADAGPPGFDFMVVRVGAGDGGLTAVAAPVFLDERRSSDGMLVRTVALPTVLMGNNRPLTLSGTAATEGVLTASGDGKYVVLAGYAAAPGTAAISTTTSATVNRVVGRVDVGGTVDTSTRMTNAFSGDSVRGACSNDGTAFWTTGNGTLVATAGVQYAALASAGTSTQVFSTVTNMRSCLIAGGRLYGGTAAGAALRVFTIGMGLPTTAGQTGTNLPGMVTTNQPQGFTLYVADGRAVASGGGVQKWTLAANTWSLATTFSLGLSAGAAGVAAAKVGNDTHVVATTLETPARVVRWVDDGTLSPMGSSLTTAQPGTTFRGVAASPK
jgi:hypothetical protein